MSNKRIRRKRYKKMREAANAFWLSGNTPKANLEPGELERRIIKAMRKVQKQLWFRNGPWRCKSSETDYIYMPPKEPPVGLELGRDDDVFPEDCKYR